MVTGTANLAFRGTGSKHEGSVAGLNRQRQAWMPQSISLITNLTHSPKRTLNKNNNAASTTHLMPPQYLRWKHIEIRQAVIARDSAERSAHWAVDSNLVLLYPRLRCTPDSRSASWSLGAPADDGGLHAPEMVAASETWWVTTVLARNIHCASCISYIKDVLASFGDNVRHVNISILCQTVEVQHPTSLKARDLCIALTGAAFDVLSASTANEHGHRVEEIEVDSQAGWLEAALKRWSYSNMQATDRHLNSSDARDDRKTRHLQNCAACQEEGMTQANRWVPPQKPGTMLVSSAKTHHKQDDGDGSSKELSDLSDSADTARRYLVTIIIGGMTCASCVNAVTAAIQALQYVSNVEVNLMTNSAKVKYVGTEEEASLIVNAVEDAGFEASVDHSKQVYPDQAKHQAGRHNEEAVAEEGSPRRSVMLRVDGMFCKHCPSRVVESLSSWFPDLIHIEQAPSLKASVLKLSYVPSQESLTIRDIVSAIDGVHEKIFATVYQPPSLEDRSQLMQAQEQQRLLKRLVVCCLVVIPTLLIGVVWMSAVPSSNATRQYFDSPVWAGTVTRAQWALFILATPVMFFAADIFHLRAIREIRALWRSRSQVPVPRRFYRFGSMNLLISAGTSVAYTSSVALLIQDATRSAQPSSHSSTYFDSVVFLTFFILIGKYLEAYSKAKTGSAVAMLGKLRPQEASLVHPYSKDDGSITSTTRKINVDLLEIGDIVIVPHGSSPPADGTVVTGSSKFNESSLTGEARDVSKNEGDVVYAGTVNTGDPVQVMVTSLGATSMLDQIISVVREGQTKRAPVERLVDTITGYFVPVITALAIFTFVIWFALGQFGRLSSKYLDNEQGGWAFWSLEFAIAVFVVACPCGIGLAAPTALFVGGGLAAKSGILVRGGGEAFQEASQVDAVVFDKTGTLTEGGRPTVTDHQILLEGDESKLVWAITVTLEETSSHPLARALLQHACSFERSSIRTNSITEEPGHGLRGSFVVPTSSTPNTTYEAAIGSEAFITTLNPSLLNYFTSSTLTQWQSQSKSIALLALRQVSPTPHTPDETKSSWTLAAIFAISDPIRPSALPTISALRSRGIPVYMLTGDNPTTASAVASSLSIPADHVFAGVLPTQKAEKIEWLKEHAPRRRASSSCSWLARSFHRGNEQQRRRKAVIAFIGDGVNDAPALSAANISIAVSSTDNNDIAITTASFVLLSPSLGNILTLFELSERVFRRIQFNFGWAMVYNAVLVPVAAGGLFWVREGGWRLGPVWGSAAMAGSSVSVVGSSLALGWGWKKARDH
ncbi:MAG: hypothetical protein LQ338_005939 [Usnochroma carphineum]|nr:MAG: hypothetical protein LQ338_005939 [Usnochroma carphineum]